MRTRIAGRDCCILDAHFCLASTRPSPTDLPSLTIVTAPRTRTWFLDAALLLAGWAGMHAYRARDDALTDLCIVLNRVYGWSVLSTVSAVCRATATWKSTRAPAPPAAPWAPSVATRGQSSTARSRAASRACRGSACRPSESASCPAGTACAARISMASGCCGLTATNARFSCCITDSSSVSLASDQRACCRRA